MNPKISPLVTVGVPVFNGDKFIIEALESIKKQTHTNFECHIVNNASTDKTKELVSEFIKTDNRFKLHSYEEYLEIAENWNRISKHISKESKYLKIVQADDWIFPQSLELMVDLMEKYPSAGICSSYRIDRLIVNCDGLNVYDGPLFDGKELLLRHLREEIDITGNSTTPLFRNTVLKQLPAYPKIFDEEEYHIDTKIFYEMMLLANVVFVFQVLSYTRWHTDSQTTLTGMRHNTFLNARERRLYRFKEFFPELEKDYAYTRKGYAYFMFKEKLKGNKKTLEWHNQNLIHKFSFSETLKSVLLMNGISFRLLSLFRKKTKRDFKIKVNVVSK